MSNDGFGIDIGGSGIKGATVDLATGELTAERHRLATPQPATPEAVAVAVAEVAAHFDWHGPMGATLPGVVKDGVLLTAANIDRSWAGTDAAALFGEVTGNPTVIINDADAAGLAEIRLGAGRGRDGVVLMVTLGTGIGFAVFNDGVLLPNTELGHIEMNGSDAEHQAAAQVRKSEGLSWEAWGRRVDQYLGQIENLLWPDLIIIGGGVSRKADKFFEYLDLRTEVVAAKLQNQAGIVGAALTASGQT